MGLSTIPCKISPFSRMRSKGSREGVFQSFENGDDLWEACCCPSKSELIWYHVLKTQHFKRTVCLSLQNIPYIFLLQGALSGRCSTAWGQNEISCQSNMLLSFRTACYKGMQHRSKHHPIVWAWHSLSKLNSILSLILIGPIHYFIAKPIVL